MKHVAVAFTLLICAIGQASLCAAQTCEVLQDENGQQRRNGSQVCVTLKITNGALDIDRSQSQFVASDEFKRRLSIPLAEAEEIVFQTLGDVLKIIPKLYLLALSEEDKAREAELTDPKTNAIRTANASWTDYLQQYDDWTSSTNRTSMLDVFREFEGNDVLRPLLDAEVSTALLVWQDSSLAADQGTFNLTVLDPINNWADETQVKISFPDLPDGPKTDARRKRVEKLLKPLSGRPRCLACMRQTIETFYKRMGFDPQAIFDGQNTSPLLIRVIESKRIVSISWRSLENDPNIDKVLYSLLTDKAFRLYVKKRATFGGIFKYLEQTSEPGPYLNAQRLQIQQLLVTQLGYAVSLTLAPGEGVIGSSYNIAIQKLSEPEEADDGGATTPATTNKHPEPAPATANSEGVVTGHEQEKEKETDFEPERKADKPKDKKRYVGGGFEYLPEQGVKFFGLGQVSRFPFLPDANNNFSVKAGGFGDDGFLGNANYFADFVFFNTLHRRMSVQFTVSSDLEANRNLTAPNTDERRSTGLARIEFELFRDLSGNLLRFFTEARNETVELKPNLEPLVKGNLTTLEFGAFYLFESVEVELPRRIRLEPKFKFGLGLAVGEPRYNKLLATGNFHQMLPGRYEIDVSGRAEVASQAAPRFELPSLGGTDILRGFRADDGLGRKLWTTQNEVWIPLKIGTDRSTGLKAMLREKVKVATFVDVGGLYDAINVSSGMRAGTGAGLRVIYNPIIFKFDFGYGFGEKATSGGRGKFHFSITSNLPF